MHITEISDDVAAEVADLLNRAGIPGRSPGASHRKIEWLGLERDLRTLSEWLVVEHALGTAPAPNLIGYAIRILTASYTGR